MSQYEMHLIVPAKLVGTIIELLDGEGILVSTAPYDEKKSQAPVAKKRKFKFAHGIKNKGVRGRELALEMVGRGPVTEAQARNIFVAKGFAPTSAQAFLSELKCEGRAKRDANGYWSLCGEVSDGH